MALKPIFEIIFQAMGKNMKKLFIFLGYILFAVTAGTAIACTGTICTAQAKNLRIAVSIAPEIAFVQEVVGDRADILCVIPEGGSPASYSPSPKALLQLRQADVYFTIGVASEGLNIAGRLPENIRIVPLHEEAAKVYPDLMLGTSRDPHIWLSPKRVMVMVRKIAEEAAALDPENKAEYEKNAQKYKEKLQAVDEEIRQIFAQTPQKIFLSFHPAFGYLADEYGLTMYALEKHGKEAGAKYLQECINIAKKNRVKAIFYQKEISSRQVEAFAREIGGKAVLLNPLAKNYGENMLIMAKTMQENM